MEFRIKEAREKAGLDQQELAGQLGIAASTLSGYESGKHDPKSDNLSRIADICGVSVDYLLGRETTPTVEEATPSDRLSAVLEELDPQQAKFLVRLVEALLARRGGDVYAAAKAEARRVWEED